MKNDEILNKNLLFKLLNREKYIRELLKIIAEFNQEIQQDEEIKKLKQEIGKLSSYIDELEYEKKPLLENEIKTKMENLIVRNNNLTFHNTQLKNKISELKQQINNYKYAQLYANQS